MFSSSVGKLIAGKVLYGGACVVAAVTLVLSGYAHKVVGLVSATGQGISINGSPSVGAMNILVMGLESRTDFYGNTLPNSPTNSSTSKITLSCWLTRSQSAWLIFGKGSCTTSLAPKGPAASLITAAGLATRSMYTRRNRCLPIFHSTSTTSRPSERATRSAAARIFSKSTAETPRP